MACLRESPSCMRVRPLRSQGSNYRDFHCREACVRKLDPHARKAADNVPGRPFRLPARGHWGAARPWFPATKGTRVPRLVIGWAPRDIRRSTRTSATDCDSYSWPRAPRRDARGRRGCPRRQSSRNTQPRGNALPSTRKTGAACACGIVGVMTTRCERRFSPAHTDSRVGRSVSGGEVSRTAACVGGGGARRGHSDHTSLLPRFSRCKGVPGLPAAGRAKITVILKKDGDRGSDFRAFVRRLRSASRDYLSSPACPSSGILRGSLNGRVSRAALLWGMIVVESMTTYQSWRVGT